MALEESHYNLKYTSVIFCVSMDSFSINAQWNVYGIPVFMLNGVLGYQKALQWVPDCAFINLMSPLTGGTILSPRAK